MIRNRPAERFTRNETNAIAPFVKTALLYNDESPTKTDCKFDQNFKRTKPNIEEFSMHDDYDITHYSFKPEKNKVSFQFPHQRLKTSSTANNHSQVGMKRKLVNGVKPFSCDYNIEGKMFDSPPKKNTYAPANHSDDLFAHSLPQKKRLSFPFGLDKTVNKPNQTETNHNQKIPQRDVNLPVFKKQTIQKKTHPTPLLTQERIRSLYASFKVQSSDSPLKSHSNDPSYTQWKAKKEETPKQSETLQQNKPIISAFAQLKAETQAEAEDRMKYRRIIQKEKETNTFQKTETISHNERVYSEEQFVFKFFKDYPIDAQIVRSPITVLKSDLLRLDNATFINDTLINFYVRNTLIPDEEHSLVYCFNTFFFSKLISVKPNEFPLIAKWIPIQSVFDRDCVLVPCHHSAEAHWSLVVICLNNKVFKEAPCIFSMDSLYFGDRKDTLNQICTFLSYLYKKDHSEELTLDIISGEEVKCPQQQTSYDCGIHVLLGIEAFTQGRCHSVADIRTLPFNAQKCANEREKIARSIYERAIKEMPPENGS